MTTAVKKFHKIVLSRLHGTSDVIKINAAANLARVNGKFATRVSIGEMRRALCGEAE
jgi:hypothetical protein